MKRRVLVWGLAASVALVSGCKEENDVFSGNWIRPGQFTQIEATGSGKYLVTHLTKDCGGIWCGSASTFDAEEQNGKLVISGAFGMKEIWEFNAEKRTIERPNNYDMLPMPTSMGKEVARRAFPNYQAFQTFYNDPEEWAAFLSGLPNN